MGKNIYETKSVHSLILTFSVPAILSLIVEIMASVVDTAFAGHLGLSSVNALTAMGLISPLLGIYTAFQALFAVSTSVLIARHLNNTEERSSYLATGILFAMITSGFVSILSYAGMGTLLPMLGAKGEVLLLTKDYLKVQLISNLFSAMGYTLTSCIRSFGYPNTEMILTGSSVIVNVVFNAIFAFGCHRGFIGLAYGTLVSEIFCAFGSVLWLVKHRLLSLKIRISAKQMLRKAWELFRLGFAQTIIQGLGGCTGFFVNNSLLLYTSADYIAVWNVVQKLYTLFLMPIVGITQGVQTVIAYYSGHDKKEEKKKAIRTTIQYTVVYGLLAAVVVYLFGANLLAIFTDSESVFLIGETVIKIIFATFPLMGVFYTIMTLFEVTGYEIKAVMLILARQVLFMLPLVYLLPVAFSDFSYAIFFAVPLADVTALIFALYMKRKTKSIAE